MNLKVTERESITEVETTDSTAFVIGSGSQGDRITKRHSLYTIEYLCFPLTPLGAIF